MAHAPLLVRRPPPFVNRLPPQLLVNTQARVQQRVVNLLTFSFFVFVVGEPFVTAISVRNVAVQEITSLPLRVQAVAYGLPLIFGAFYSRLIPRRLVRFPLCDLLDFIATAMMIYWGCETIHGWLRENKVSHILSTSFNYQVPSLVYLSMRRLSSANGLELLRTKIVTACTWAVPLSLAATIYAVLGANYIGAGGVTHMLPFAAGVFLVTAGRMRFGTILMLASVAVILASMKRAVWGGLIAFPMAYLLVVPRALKQTLRLTVAGSVLLIAGVFASTFLPEQFQIDVMLDRAYSVLTETDGFRHGQARQDEYESITEAVLGQDSYWDAAFGLGLGATYTYYADRSTRDIFYEHNDSHFSPIGWMLRGGMIGMCLNIAFYLVACLSCLKCSRLTMQSTSIAWRQTFVAYFLIAVFLSGFSFSLTPNVATHIILLTILLTHGSESATKQKSRGFVS